MRSRQELFNRSTLVLTIGYYQTFIHTTYNYQLRVASTAESTGPYSSPVFVQMPEDG